MARPDGHLEHSCEFGLRLQTGNEREPVQLVFILGIAGEQTACFLASTVHQPSSMFLSKSNKVLMECDMGDPSFVAVKRRDNGSFA